MNKGHISSTKLFQSNLTRNSLFQHITFPIYILGNTLDMIITKDNSALVSTSNLSELVSAHYVISLHVEYIKHSQPKKLITYRKVTQINLNDFISDIRSNFKKDTSIPLIDIFNNILEMTFNEPAPIISLLITERINNHWYNDTCANGKRTLRNKNIHTASIKLQLIFIISLMPE